MPKNRTLIYLLLLLANSVLIISGDTNYPPSFVNFKNNVVLSENTPVGTVVNQLEGSDPENSKVTFGSIVSEHFEVDPVSGTVTLIKPLDREEKESLTFLVTIRDQVSPDGESESDNIVQQPLTFIIADENDNAPEFFNTPYGADVPEDTPIGTVIFSSILVKDRDSVGESLDIKCVAQSQSPDACDKFRLDIVSREPSILTANVSLNEALNYNQRTIYHFLIEATDGVHQTQTHFEVRVKDIQDKPPVFLEYKSNVIDEDSPINTLVLRIQARDGDTGEPRKIVYDLLTNAMDYFLLNEHTGELRTAKPLDREALPDGSGIIKLTVRAREVVNGVPSNDPMESSTTIVTITIRDVNDSPPTFNSKEYEVSLPENTATGTPLALDMNVTDRDVGINSKFSLRLEDVSDVFEVEPKLVTGFSQVHIRVANGSLDYENPNQRKFIVLVIAEETDTNPKLSSTATITVSVLDVNDNKPIFEEQSYSGSISESALPGQYITTITAKDLDSGNFGDAGIRYSLTGNGASLFDVNEKTGVITLADCNKKMPSLSTRRRRQLGNYLMSYQNDDEVHNDANFEYKLIRTPDAVEVNNELMAEHSEGTKNCLDYETETTYFLAYNARDDEGRGQNSVVSLRISVTDANDSPPICESPHYRASVDEGSHAFDAPLIVKARDADTVSDITYSIVGDKHIQDTFVIDKETGHITIRPNATLDVTHLNNDNLVFSVEANDGLFTANCMVNITVRDVNNHKPRFLFNEYKAEVEENSEIGRSVDKLQAEDLDSGINAQLKYRIQQGSFDDFRIDENTGEVFVSRKLDYDKRNSYEIEVIAMDMGTPSLSGTATLTVDILNSNDKDPYFTPATQHAEVREDTIVGTIFYTLVAIDPDVSSRDALEFAGVNITAVDKDGNEVENSEQFKEYFTITRSGNVIVNKKLNRNLFAVIRINVLVTDSTAPTVQQGMGLLIIQIIDVNEVAPKFSLPWTSENPVIKLQMVEEQPLGSVLTTLQAYDEDSTIGEYDISKNDYFEINKTTGIITLTKRLDYETIKEVKFVATVSDTGIPPLTSTADVIVDVINLNDNEPQFTENEYYFNITENTQVGTVAGRVEAFDKDLGAFGEITYSLIGENNKYFTIDSYTGNIMVADSSILDREKVKQITLTVVAKDKAPNPVSKSTSAAIHLNILDVNDNAPEFTQNEYTSTVAENAALNPPAAILQVKAFDLDEGTFGDVRYYIKTGNDEQLFRLDSQSGILYPARSLNGQKGIYELMISARDEQGHGPIEAITKVIINVMGVNQHRPVFLIPASSNATIEIPGDVVAKDYLILTVKAADNDTDENGKIFYHLQVKDQNLQETDEFKIDAESGELRTNGDLQRKEKANYDLILVARDNGNPKPFETLRFLTISIIDANENRPEFPDASNPYKISIMENNERNVKIGKIQATARNKHNRDVFYYMLLGNEDGAFVVDKTTGDIYTNKTLDREITDFYTLYILASIKRDLHISDEERAAFSIKTLDRDNTVAKVIITVLDENDNAPLFETEVYYAGVNAKAQSGTVITTVNATDADAGKNAHVEYMITTSNLYKFGATKSMGSIVPSPFTISQDGKVSTGGFVAEYNQDRFELEIVAKEMEEPKRSARTKVIVWIYDYSQLVRVILSRPPDEVYQQQEEIVAELRNATQHRIIVDEIRYHVDSMTRVRVDWTDLYFHAVDSNTQQISPVDEILKVIDANYDYLRDYYAGFAIENVVPAYITIVQEEFDLAVAGLVALVIVLFVGVVSFIVLCCCLKHWNLSVPTENRRKEALIKKQIIEDLNTTENPLWIEQKLKLYEEQELTMQVFSEPDHISNSDIQGPMDHCGSMEQQHVVDNTYATIQPRNHGAGNGAGMGGNSPNPNMGSNNHGRIDPHMTDFADYATLRNNRVPSMFEFTGSTFQAPIRDGDDVVTELI
ncbi:cadherin-87A isoform X1 [Stomoxys calcitrans]|uniref:cadherin-87A isoform X1 n=1 Tax=Stomoxys calcitrans TaxID=35570 RepID=UPI0027E2ADB6|nr:cadherin-87A isoform X1 [Stomoxys calcitrans]XP_059218580.1 cadherin-87A isoform X1 [Stomoxys calcitrans]